jgi:hypothetical protein
MPNFKGRGELRRGPFAFAQRSARPRGQNKSGKKLGFSGFFGAYVENAPITCAFLGSRPFILREMP